MTRSVLAFTMTRRGRTLMPNANDAKPFEFQDESREVLIFPRTTTADLLRIDHAIGVYARLNRSIGACMFVHGGGPECALRLSHLMNRAARVRRIIAALVDRAAGMPTYEPESK